ncbi:phospholipase D-like domain-containing protein [Phormidesmis sp. 146-35]
MQPLPFLKFTLTGTALALCLAACQQAQPQPSRPASLPQETAVQVYTNHNPAAEYTESYRQQTRSGDDLEQIMVDAIASAQTSVDVAVQEFRLPKIAQALSDRQKAGVKVRVILENTYSRPFSSFTPDEIEKLVERERDRLNESRKLIDQDGDGQLSPTEINQRDALVMLDDAKIPRIDDTADGSRGSHLMHHKFVIVDGRSLIITSANFTLSDVHGDLKSPSSRGNANNLLKIDSPELAALFTQEFNLMWGDGVGGKQDSRFGTKKPHRPSQQINVGGVTIEVQFSPSSASIPWTQTTNGLIGKALSQAKQSIDLALFVFSDQPLVNLLEPQHLQGRQIRALIDPGFIYRSYSEGLDMLGVALNDDCKSEPNNRPWSDPISTVGIPRLPPGDLLHHKFGIVDGETVITGSHNWATAANQGNDETLLVVSSPLVAAHFQREFERLYGDAVLGVPPAVRRKIKEQRQKCPQLAAALPPPTASVQDKGQDKGREDKGRSLRVSRKGSLQATRKESIPTPKPSASSGQQVNLNTATQAELEALPGVGPGLATRIIAARQQKAFSSLDDLDRVSGVGPKLLEKLRDRVTL